MPGPEATRDTDSATSATTSATPPTHAGGTVTISRGAVVAFVAINVLLLLGLAVTLTVVLMRDSMDSVGAAPASREDASAADSSDRRGGDASPAQPRGTSDTPDGTSNPNANPDRRAVASRFRLMMAYEFTNPLRSSAMLERIADGTTVSVKIGSSPDPDITVVGIRADAVEFRRYGVEDREVLRLSDGPPSDPTIPQFDLEEFTRRNAEAEARRSRPDPATTSGREPNVAAPGQPTPAPGTTADDGGESADGEESRRDGRGQTIVMADGSLAAVPSFVDADAMRRYMELLESTGTSVKPSDLLADAARTIERTLTVIDVVSFRDGLDAMLDTIVYENAVDEDNRAAGIRLVNPFNANSILRRYGFEPNDVIITINGQSVVRVADLDTALEDKASFSDGLDLTFWRGGAIWTARLKVDHAAVAALEARLATGDALPPADTGTSDDD